MREIRHALLRWYRANKRDLPWRRTDDSYRIWVSEVMLTQTRVETVVPYYERFLKAFPDVRALARAPEARVLKQWEGLGYYARVRHLRAAAREVLSRYGGSLPRSAAGLRSLPGFGPYTSAAVASIAFDEAVAVFDGNVRRVMSRLFLSHDGLAALAQSLLDPKNPCDCNQAVMELGALVCLPRRPKCPLCPLRVHCRALAAGQIARYPAHMAHRKPLLVHSVAIVLWRRSKVLVVPRPRRGRYGGLWEFPTFEASTFSSAFRSARRAFGDLNLGFVPTRRPPPGFFDHHLSHRTIRMRVFKVRSQGETGPKTGRWVSPGRLETLPLSRLQQRVRDAALCNRKPRSCPVAGGKPGWIP